MDTTDMRQPINVNLETFKETFQKPSQIYKYLREHWNNHPLFLNRTLGYVREHRSPIYCKKDKRIDLIAKKLLRININKEKSGSERPNGNGSSHLNGTAEKKYDINANSTTENRSNNSDELACYFNWVCNDPARTNQKTRSAGFICPWCERDLIFLDPLMAHLKYCHPRFTFNIVEDDSQSSVPIIEMVLNLSFDGSYCGFKYPGHDLRRDFRFTPSYPERRMPMTQIIFFKTKKGKSSRSLDIIKHRSSIEGDTFAYDDGEADVDVCSGRLYYHTSTCLPVKPNEVDIDSEADMDPDWLRERTQLMIDEFTDVNEGEKEILKLWNLHIMKNYKYKGDSMIPQACLDFVELEGPKVLSKNLCKNFTLHLANLYDFGLLGSGDILKCIRKLNKLRPVLSSPNKITGKIKLDRNSNEHCQHSSPAKRALINMNS